MFGRPDIGAYLKDTFAMRVESPGVMDESGLDTSDEIDVSAPNADPIDTFCTPQSAEARVPSSAATRTSSTCRTQREM